MLLALVRDHIDDRRVLDLVGQYPRRTGDENCLYSTVTQGISLGYPLSPVMAALYLEAGSPQGGHWFDLRPLPGRLAMRIVNQTLREPGVEQHPDKTFIGWIERGFTFLGYWITKKGVIGVARPQIWMHFKNVWLGFMSNTRGAGSGGC